MGFLKDIWDKITNHINQTSQANQAAVEGAVNLVTEPIKETINHVAGEGHGGGSFGSRPMPEKSTFEKTMETIIKKPEEYVKPITENEKPNTELNNITDSTNENIEKPIENDILSFMEEQQAKQWEREDTIRKETQAREDSAYQRTVKDMQAAGINPNLMNVSPAASGGGITSATGLDYTAYTNNLKETLTLLEQEIENTFKEDENTKDRFNQLISSLVMALLFKK